ncbi:hypothetical protein B0T17DRAFT_235117 [Bombardia bombarda]|uniref:Uncharacterized protein n=1 Tax=Bombardia bombarda TaxID=252184 RepID=A0AA39XC33_9PEZI|nr:hypothetical protein B0T17DRAFT_235117 [Bombardia bombarda]
MTLNHHGSISVKGLSPPRLLNPGWHVGSSSSRLQSCEQRQSTGNMVPCVAFLAFSGIALATTTVSNPYDCPRPVPTVHTGYDCSSSKCPGGCSTAYVFATSTSSCSPDSPSTTITASMPESCIFRPTQTFYSSSGCALTCSSGFCVIDAPVTISCGCPSVEITPTTITTCPTKTPCYQCYTGWGTFKETQSCPPTTAQPAAQVTVL